MNAIENYRAVLFLLVVIVGYIAAYRFLEWKKRRTLRKWQEKRVLEDLKHGRGKLG
jgi:hypothetical protein